MERNAEFAHIAVYDFSFDFIALTLFSLPFLFPPVLCRDEQFDDVVLKEVDEDVIGAEEREGSSAHRIMSASQRLASPWLLVIVFLIIILLVLLCSALADLSQEKSRVGLGEVYAEDFLASATSGKSGAKEAKDNAVRDELKELYHKVPNSTVITLLVF
jgi:hypothetical protein